MELDDLKKIKPHKSWAQTQVCELDKAKKIFFDSIVRDYATVVKGEKPPKQSFWSFSSDEDASQSKNSLSWEEFCALAPEGYHLVAKCPSAFSGTSKGLQRCQDFLTRINKCSTTEELIVLAEICSSGGDRFRKAVADAGVHCINVRILSEDRKKLLEEPLIPRKKGNTNHFVNLLTKEGIKKPKDQNEENQKKYQKEVIAYKNIVFSKLAREIGGGEYTQNEKELMQSFAHRLPYELRKVSSTSIFISPIGQFVNNLKKAFCEKFGLAAKKVEMPRLGFLEHTVQHDLYSLGKVKGSSLYAGFDEIYNGVESRRIGQKNEASMMNALN